MKEWYLMDNHKPNIVSGYEGDMLSDFARSNFNDVLETTFSDIVTLYNYDLSESKEIRCIIQGNTADTRVNSIKRTGIFPIGTVNAGMYVYFDNAFWLITGCPGNNKSYEKVTLDFCQYKLKWQNAKGDIIERWGNFTSASKYDDGLQDGRTMILSSDNLNILLPNDEESLELAYKRVFVDTKALPEKVYIISRTDDVLYNFGERGGILSFIADKTELDLSKDNQELGICDYVAPAAPPENDDETTVLTGSVTGVISGNTNLKVGFERTYTAKLADSDGNVVEWDERYRWNVVSLIDINIRTAGNKAKIIVEDDEFVDEKFKLQILDGDILIAEAVVTIVGMI